MSGLEEERARLRRLRERLTAHEAMEAISEAQRAKREAFGRGSLIGAHVRREARDTHGRPLPVVRCAACKRGVHRHARGKGCNCEAPAHGSVIP